MRSAPLAFALHLLQVSVALLAITLSTRPATAQTITPANLMPQPANVTPGSGALHIDSNFALAFTGYTEPRLDRARERFFTQLHWQTAIPFGKTANSSSRAMLTVHTGHASKEIQELGEDESYRLEVMPTGAKLDAANPLGVLRGLHSCNSSRSRLTVLPPPP